ncbi:MAG TPA: nitroreductase/quinone reductase family protein [Amycolatopsis sp.]|nr:nitroreductase/quinone reductase family protein [Amycolatopsis sp.]
MRLAYRGAFVAQLESPIGLVDRFAARARTLSREEKSDAWPSLVEVFAPYAAYQRKTSRDIPVVRLHPQTGE